MSVVLMAISLERTSTPLIAASKAMIAAHKFFTVIDAPRQKKGEYREPEVSATDDIVFKDVCFAYPGRSHVKVLDGLNLRIEAGKLTAIVGPSGSGKSTIVSLIERWYSLHDQSIDKTVENGNKLANDELEYNRETSTLCPREIGPPVQLRGSVSTSRHELDEIDIKWWRSQIGLVQQEPFLFNDTIYNNVAHGLVGSEWENVGEAKKIELVKEACREAFADEFINQLPNVCLPLFNCFNLRLILILGL